MYRDEHVDGDVDRHHDSHALADAPYVPNVYTVPPGGIVTVNVNSAVNNLQGPIGAEFTASVGGSFIAYSVGNTQDFESYVEDSAVPAIP